MREPSEHSTLRRWSQRCVTRLRRWNADRAWDARHPWQFAALSAACLALFVSAGSRLDGVQWDDSLEQAALVAAIWFVARGLVKRRAARAGARVNRK